MMDNDINLDGKDNDESFWLPTYDNYDDSVNQGRASFVPQYPPSPPASSAASTPSVTPSATRSATPSTSTPGSPSSRGKRKRSPSRKRQRSTGEYTPSTSAASSRRNSSSQNNPGTSSMGSRQGNFAQHLSQQFESKPNGKLQLKIKVWVIRNRTGPKMCYL